MTECLDLHESLDDLDLPPFGDDPSNPLWEGVDEWLQNDAWGEF